ncbi:MAG: hypothetical protein ACI9H6_000054 [Patiriisocius sp.]|jgi:hypothetical protein
MDAQKRLLLAVFIFARLLIASLYRIKNIVITYLVFIYSA